MTRRVMLPGASFGPSVPQLFLPPLAAMRRGAERVAVEWRDVAEVDALPDDARPGWVLDRAVPALEGADPSAALIVGKSLGTYAAGAVAARGLPAIWITPLLTEAVVVAGLHAARAPFLLVGGTADPWWDGAVARAITPHVLELDGADHGLFVPGPLRRSVANLGRLADAAEAFLDQVVWPG